MAEAEGVPSSVLDPVAGVLREDVFRYFLSHEISRAVRYRNFFSLCLVGVTNGTGDGQPREPRFVRTVSEAIGAALRRTDPIGVLPEGFGLLLLDVADQPAHIVAERVQRNLRDVAVAGEGSAGTREITISVGGACFPRDGQTEAALFTHATRCLEVARQRGGNRVVYHPDAP